MIISWSCKLQKHCSGFREAIHARAEHSETVTHFKHTCTCFPWALKTFLEWVADELLYPRCVAGKPSVCESSTRFQFSEGCCLVVRAVNHALHTRRGGSHAPFRAGRPAGTVNTCEVLVSNTLSCCYGRLRGCAPAWGAELPSQHSPLFSPPHPDSHSISSTFTGMTRVHLPPGRQSAQHWKDRPLLGLVVLAAKILAETCFKFSKSHLMTFSQTQAQKTRPVPLPF